MDKHEVISFLKNHKNFYDKNLEYVDEHRINYIIGKNTYTINLYSNWENFEFSFSNSNINVRTISQKIKNDNVSERSVIIHFGKMLKKLDKLYYYTNQLKNDEDIKSRIKKYVQYKYNFEIDFELKKNEYLFTLPSMYIWEGYRQMYVNFDVHKYEKENVIYEITVRTENENIAYTLNFKYNSENNRLLVQSESEYHREVPKDLTKIIRGEKLKKIMFA